MNRVKRYVTVFSKNDNDEYIKDEFELKDVNLGELQELFSVSMDDPMYDCFEITKKEAQYFIDKFSLKLDLSSYAYYLECYLDE